MHNEVGITVKWQTQFFGHSRV